MLGSTYFRIVKPHQTTDKIADMSRYSAMIYETVEITDGFGKVFFSQMKYLDYHIFYCFSIVCRSVSSVGQHQANKWFITRGFFFKKKL